MISIPQGTVIGQERIDRWLMRHKWLSDDQKVWHLKRATGFGGSDVGALLRHRYQTGNGFRDARQVVSDKLFLSYLDSDSWHLIRGKLLEDLARAVFRKKFQAVPDTASLENSNLYRHKAIDSAVGNPDDAVFIGSQRFIPDYKCPADATDDVEFDYVAQLHHYSSIYQSHDIRVDGSLLVKLDLPEAFSAGICRKLLEAPDTVDIDQIANTIVQLDMPGFGLMVKQVGLSGDFMKKSLDTCQSYWDQYVMHDTLPERLKLKKDDRTDVSDSEISETMASWLHCKLLLDEGRKQLKVYENALKAVDPSYLDDKQLALPAGSRFSHQNAVDIKGAAEMLIAKGVSEQSLLDKTKTMAQPRADVLLQRLVALGEDISDVQLYQPIYDPKAVKEALSEKGIPEQEFSYRSVAPGLSSRKQDKESLEFVRTEARQVFATSLAALNQPLPFDDAVSSNEHTPK